MALIVCTPGGTTDNCYVTAAQANAYFANTLRAAGWTAETATAREQALIQATQEVERCGGNKDVLTAARGRFPGLPLSDLQSLHYPREDDYDAAGVLTVPQDIREAVCEQAYYLLQQRTNPDLVPYGDLRARGVQNVSADGLSIGLTYTDLPRGIAPAAWERLRGFVLTSYRTVP